MVEERPAGRGWIDLIQSTLIEVARGKMGSPNPQLIENKRENDKIKKRRRNSQKSKQFASTGLYFERLTN